MGLIKMGLFFNRRCLVKVEIIPQEEIPQEEVLQEEIPQGEIPREEMAAPIDRKDIQSFKGS